MKTKPPSISYRHLSKTTRARVQIGQILKFGFPKSDSFDFIVDEIHPHGGRVNELVLVCRKLTDEQPTEWYIFNCRFGAGYPDIYYPKRLTEKHDVKHWVQIRRRTNFENESTRLFLRSRYPTAANKVQVV